MNSDSFAIFDYSAVVDFANKRKTAADAANATSQAELDSLTKGDQTLPAGVREQTLKALIAFHSEEHRSYDSLIAEITAVNSLSDENKQALYSLYRLSGVLKNDWMTKMLFNTSEMLKSLPDSSLATPQKEYVAKSIYQSCVINKAARLVQTVLRAGAL